ncbi:SusC/RagA family TonB-linked outer membrane protein [Fulvivirga sediminis]|uniref:SusC/RagA family TonB-linked outer membrane protein n=1 Tax=Fulvivirga sediminis TaxID=2803949 RepID=A0A937K2I3_9BACT|nr:SusC/RagA family TonB-linked outer membrane protein [Fulvivirga sediminis]MBL3658405.1 SusC/RagA family TonB-linked outer membrane protein [Fulvivirga sediminis]
MYTVIVLAQDNSITISQNGGKTVSEIFELIETQTNYQLIYSDESITNAPTIYLEEGRIEINQLLKKVLPPMGCDYKITSEDTIIITKVYTRGYRVSGTINDVNGNAIPGAHIVEEGTFNGVVSDNGGKYDITVSDKMAPLIISYIGYSTQDVDINNRSIIDVTLLPEYSELDEVIVTALVVERKRKELGYSFQDVGGDELRDNPTSNMIQSLYGKIAGLDITQTASGLGASSRVVIRGNNSIIGNNQPLYVIDGIVIDNAGISGLTDGKSDKYAGGLDHGDVLSSLNPYDIDKISVLKGGAASALYGERGANGVIIITTKKGKNNSLSIDYSGTFTIDKAKVGYEEYQREYGSGERGQLPDYNDLTAISYGTVNAWGPKFGEDRMIRIFDRSFKPYQNNDKHIEDFFKTGSSYHNNLSLYGGADDITYRVSYGHLKRQGVIPTSSLERHSFTISTGIQKSKMSVDWNLFFVPETSDNRPALADDPNNLGFSLSSLAPNIDQAWLRNYRNGEGKYHEWNPNSSLLNPYFVIAENTNHSSKNSILGNLHVNYHLNNWLRADLNVGLDRYNHEVSDFMGAGSNLAGNREGSLTYQSASYQEYNVQGVLFAEIEYDKLSVSAALGGNYRSSNRVDEGYVASGMIDKDVKNLSNYLKKVLGPKTDQEIMVRSLFSYWRVNYDGIFFLDFTARNDWNSTLATPLVSYSGYRNDYSFFYPSISGSFIFSEVLNVSSSLLSFGKLRASMARTGKAPEFPYTTSIYYTVGAEPLHDNPLGFINDDRLPNERLSPEISNTFEIGADLSLLDNQITVDFSFYRTITKNQLTVLSISQTSGFYSAWQNIGKVKNSGIEAVISAKIMNKPSGFTWNLALNAAKNNNEVVHLNDNTDMQVISMARWGGAQVVAQVGQSTTEIMGRQLLRSPEGKVIVGENGLPKLNGTYKSFGKATPDWILGVINNFSYKRFTLEADIDMKFGGHVYSMTNANAAAAGLLNITKEGRSEYNDWVQKKLNEGLTPEQIDSFLPEAGYVVDGVKELVDANGNVIYRKNTQPVNPQDYWQLFAGDNTTVTPEPFIYNASFAKLRSLTLSFDLPRSLLQKSRFNIERIKVSLIGRNLWTIYSQLPNIDPESTYSNGNGQGLEYGSLPYSKSYGFNIQMTF